MTGTLFSLNKHEAAADEWIEAHPDAFVLFCSLACSMANKCGRVGFKAVAERLRWEYTVERSDGDFKINNNHVTYLGRRCIERFPHLSALVETRTTHTN